ncbi:MAG: tyrosine-type recombinase/integrase [Burkholderiales bacterium]|nr:tyrosine-type recombinase/integrase [Burkholderiales bacterium]
MAARSGDPAAVAMHADFRRAVAAWVEQLHSDPVRVGARADLNRSDTDLVTGAPLPDVVGRIQDTPLGLAARALPSSSAIAGSTDPAVAPAAPAAATMVQSIAHSLTTNRPVRTRKTTGEYERIFTAFAAWCADRRITTLAPITAAHLAAYKKHLVEARQLAPKTINKALTALGQLFRDAQAAGHYPPALPVPTCGHLFKKKAVSKSVRSWLPLTPEDLTRVSDPATFGAFVKPHEFWVPLLLLHQGLRVGEASQLSTSDIREEDGLWVLEVTDEREGASVKSDASRRIVPLHPALVDLGLPDYLQDVRTTVGEGLLFPYLRVDWVNGFGDVPGESLKRYLKRILAHPRKRSHSFRHTVNGMLKQAGVSEEHRAEFVGHEHDIVNSTVYAERLAPTAMASIVFPFLKFPLDYPRLRYQAGRLTEIIQAELGRRRRHERRRTAARARIASP